MVSEWALNITESISKFFGITNIGGVYFVAFCIAIFLAVYTFRHTEDKRLSGGVFLLILFIMSMIDWFPLWIIMMSLIIIVASILKLGDRSE